ncbi:MAG: hypothetical protein V4697_00350 [Patescibacteria group bacterium]
MEQVVTVEPEKNPRPFDVAFLWQVHTPVHVFIGCEVASEGETCTTENSPFVREDRKDKEGNQAGRYDYRTIPPSHRDGSLVLFFLQVIAVIRPEDVMVNKRMLFERVSPPERRPVHKETMKRPFKERRQDNSREEADSRPK